MDFFKNRISLERRQELASFVNTFPHGTSGLSFSSLYMWGREYSYSYEIINGCLCVAGLSNFEGEEEAPFLFPVLPGQSSACGLRECAAEDAEAGDSSWDNDDIVERLRDTLEILIQRFDDYGKPFVIRLIPPVLRKLYEKAMPERFVFIDDPSNYDYIYRVSDLAALRGKPFHGKKNHVNRFDRLYGEETEIVPLSSGLTGEILELVKRINGRKEVTGLERMLLDSEYIMMKDILPDFEKAGMEGIALRIGGRLEAFAFGGPLGKDTIVEHVEKANVEYSGIYQKLNNAFCKEMEGKYEFVNREEDMGIEGLRKSKMSYKPACLLDKRIALLAGDEKAMECYGEPF